LKPSASATSVANHASVFHAALLAVTLAAHHGLLQLNACEPLTGLAVIEAQQLLYEGSMLLRTKCVDGITVNQQQLQRDMDTTVGIVTALNPVIGFE
jgi:aspartate ammonia-lyase